LNTHSSTKNMCLGGVEYHKIYVHVPSPTHLKFRKSFILIIISKSFLWIPKKMVEIDEISIVYLILYVVPISIKRRGDNVHLNVFEFAHRVLAADEWYKHTTTCILCIGTYLPPDAMVAIYNKHLSYRLSKHIRTIYTYTYYIIHALVAYNKETYTYKRSNIPRLIYLNISAA